MLKNQTTKDSLECSNVSYYVINPMLSPRRVVLLVLGLGSHKRSDYVINFLKHIKRDVSVYILKGLESSITSRSSQILRKDDHSRVCSTVRLLNQMTGMRITLFGFSLGGALCLQALQEISDLVYEVICVSTTFDYHHAMSTMKSSLSGCIISKALVIWQFHLFWSKPNILWGSPLRVWLRLLFSSSMLDQDRVLFEKIGEPVEEYWKRLRFEGVLSLAKVTLIVSTKDPMISPNHLKHQMTISQGQAKFIIGTGGGHNHVKEDDSDLVAKLVSEI